MHIQNSIRDIGGVNIIAVYTKKAITNCSVGWGWRGGFKTMQLRVK